MNKITLLILALICAAFAWNTYLYFTLLRPEIPQSVIDLKCGDKFLGYTADGDLRCWAEHPYYGKIEKVIYKWELEKEGLI